MALDPFGPSEGLDPSVPVAGLDPFAPDPAAPGAFSKGIRVGVGGVKSTLYGTGALAARVVGAKDLEQAALTKAAAAQEEVAGDIQTIEQVDWTDPSSIANQFKFLLGQAIPSIATTVAGGVVGRGVGTALSRRMAAPAAAQVQRASTIAGAAVPSFSMGAGSIFPEALETGAENPAARAIAGGTATAALDLLPILAAERYLKAAGKGGVGSLLKGAAKGAPVGAVLEGAQETAQSAVERLAAGLPLSGPEALSDYLNSFAGGAVPGSVIGAGVGAARGRRGAQPTPEPFQPPAAPPVEEQPQPLPEILQGPALEQQLSDQALFASLNPPADVLPPAPDAGPEVTPQPGYNRAMAPVAQEADFTTLETLRAQKRDADARQAELTAELSRPEGQRRTKQEITREQMDLRTQIGALDTQIGQLTQTIRNRFAAEDAAAAIEAAPDKAPAAEPFFTESGAFKRPQGQPTEAAELEVARQKRSVGALVSAREAKLLRDADRAAPPAPAVMPVTTNQPRERFKQESPARRAEVIEGVAAQSVEDHLKGLKFRKGTEPQAAQALRKAVAEAATAPTIEAAEKAIFDAAIKALSGKVNKADAETFAESVAKDVRSAPTFYSQAAAAQRTDVIEFSHWGDATTQTDPARMGTGVKGADWALAQEVGLQYTSAVVRGAPYREPAVQGKPERVGTLAADRVYSARTDDPLLIQAKADLRAQGIFNDALAWMQYAKAVRDLGYDAMLYANGQLRIFTPQRVRAASRAAVAPKKLSDLTAKLAPIVATHAAAGGSSTNLVTGQDLGGTDNYTVSVHKNRERTFKQAPTEADLRKYVEDNADLLADPQNILGTWYNRADKLHYVDVSRTVRDLATALDLGRKNKQHAIFYLGTFDEIPVGNAEVYGLSQLYAQQMSLPPAVALEYKQVPVERMTLVAEAYDWLRDNATALDVRIQNVYETFVQETEKQFEFISRHIRIEPWRQEGQPYANSRAMMDDVAKNKHLWVYEGGDPHPFMTAEQNWKFRAVHDLFGHAKTGFEFGPRGEFNATRAHAQMYTEEAWPALVTETIGQNAWVNFGAQNAGLPAAQRAYAVQKADLLPESMWRDLLEDPIEARVASVDQHERVMAEKGQRLIDRIRGMIGDAPVDINVFEAKPGQPLGYYQGRVGKMKAVIAMATNAKDELSIADHEGFHALEDMVLEGREKSIISRQLRPGATLFKRLAEKTRAYDAANGTRLTDEILSVPQEARAYGYEFWRRGELQVDGALATVFEKIRNFIERIVNFIDGLGFQSVEDIFRMIELGAMASRAKRAGGANAQYSQASADGQITITRPVDGSYSIKLNGREIGTANLSENKDYLVSVIIEEKYRRKGYGSTLYDFIEQDIGRRLIPSPRHQSPAAKALWAKRNKTAADQTKTTAFKKWFGDSKVVDAEGKPLVVYHGTVGDFAEFKTTRTGEFGPAIYTTADGNEAAQYGVGAGSRHLSQPPVSVMPVYVSLQNPFVDGVEAYWKRFGREDSTDAEAVQRAIAAGFDGVIATRKEWNDKTLTHYVAFKPEQIKSAVGNRGTFDPKNPNILYSKAAMQLDREMAKGGQERAQEYLAAADLINDAYQHGPDNVFKTAFGALKSELGGDLSRWFKRNILTPNFTSRYSEGFKNVFTTLNTYDRYRSILIKTMLKEKMPAWYDASADDQKVTFKALLDRTVKGMTVDSSEYQALMANLTTEQRALFRSASSMIEGFLRAELESDKVTYRQLLTTPGEYEKWLADRTTQVQEMIDKGYVPLRRYGDHTVVIIKTITGKDGNPQDLVVARQGFTRAATAEVAGQMYKDEIARTGADLRVEVGYQHKAARDTTISVQQFLDTARRNGVPLNQLERERIVKALTSAESLTRNRMLHREGTAGYSEDGLRVLNEFGVGMAGKMAYAKFASAVDAASEGYRVTADIIDNEPMISVDESINAVTGKPNNLWAAEGPKAGFHRNLADELTDFVLVPDHTGGWSRNLRGAAMMYFLGGSISGAMVNTMSVPMLVVPQLSISTNYYNAMATTLSAWKTTWANQAVLRDTAKLKDAVAYPIPDIDRVPGLRQALVQAAEDGRTMDTEIHGIMGMAQGTMYSQSRGVQRAIETWMAPFRISEQTNRITAFIAGYKVGQENKLTGRELYNYAAEMVDSTQNNYNESNRPGIARNHIFALMYMFKSFPMFMVEAAVLMHKANPAAARNMLLGMVVMTGVQGLPFAETLMDLIDTIAQKIFGSPFNSRRAIRNFVKQGSEAIVGYDLSSLVLRGVINDVLGMSVASRIGAGDFVPGTRLGTADAEQGRLLEDMLGAPYAMLKDTLTNAGKLVGGVTTGDWRDAVDALRAGGPVAVRNIIKGTEQLTEGYASDSKGRRLIDVSTPEALWQLTGMASARLAKAYDYDRIDKQTMAFYSQVRTDMQRQLVKAVRDGDEAKVQETWDAARAWDETYPDMPLRLSPSAIRREVVMSGLRLDERTMRLLPRALRGTSLAAEGIEGE